MILEPQPPANIEAERGLIGSVMLDGRAFDLVADFLRPEHFHVALHREVWDVMARMLAEGVQPNPVLLLNQLSPEAMAELVKHDPERPHAYIAGLMQAAITVVNARHYGLAIHEMWRRRSLIEAATEASEAAYRASYDDNAGEIIARTFERLDGLTGDPTRRSPTLTVGEAAASALREADAGKSAGVSTGIAGLDKLIGGFRKGQLITLGGTAGMGKSGLALGCARAATGAGTVAFFTLEMTPEQQSERAMSADTGISLWRISQGYLRPDERERLEESAARLASMPLIFDGNRSMTVRETRRRAGEMQRKGPLSLVVVDYLQLMCGEGRADNRAAEVAAITRGLKVLAGELDVPVLALSQLSRKVDNREDKRPELGDLRESGSIEQDSDVVLFCYRPGYYLERKRPVRVLSESKAVHENKMAEWEADIRQADNEAEIIVAKQRQGPANKIVLVRFDRETAQYIDDVPEQQRAAGY